VIQKKGYGKEKNEEAAGKGRLKEREKDKKGK